MLLFPLERLNAYGESKPKTCPQISAVDEASPVPIFNKRLSFLIFACLLTILKIGALCFFGFLRENNDVIMLFAVMLLLKNFIPELNGSINSACMIIASFSVSAQNLILKGARKTANKSKK